MNYITTHDGFDFYKFRPSVFHLFYKSYETMTFMKWCRFSIAAMRGSHIYYMMNNGEVYGYCLLETGGGRYTFSNKDDLIIAPYIIAPEKRGNGYATIMLKYICSQLCVGHKVFAMVKVDNYASIRVMQKLGFAVISKANNFGFQRKYVLSKDPTAGYLAFALDA